MAEHAENRLSPAGRARGFALRIFALAPCVFALTVSFSPRPRAEKKPEYTVAFYGPETSTSEQGQFRSVFTDIAKTINERENFVIAPIYFSNEKDLLSAAKKGKVDFVISGDNYVTYRLVREYRFQSFLNFSYLNTKVWKPCIYTKANKNYRNVKDLKNARITTLVSPDYYIMIRHIIGEDPMEFFNGMIKAKDSYSLFYALSLDTCDAVYTTNLSYNAMKKTNPGPLKGVKELACAAETFPVPGFYYSKKVPKPVIERVGAILKNAHKDDAFKKWWPLMKSFGLRFTDSSIADYKMLFQLFENAEKRGWMKDYERFVKSAQED